MKDDQAELSILVKIKQKGLTRNDGLPEVEVKICFRPRGQDILLRGDRNRYRKIHKNKKPF